MLRKFRGRAPGWLSLVKHALLSPDELEPHTGGRVYFKTKQEKKKKKSIQPLLSRSFMSSSGRDM